MHILFATAELRPLVSAGGLGEAAAGLVAGLRALGHQVTVVLPDYAGWPLEVERRSALALPEWAQPASVRQGTHPEAGDVIVVSVPGIDRPDPYVDADGQGWPDNDRRFAAFAAAVAYLADHLEIDVLHLNDWHTSLASAFVGHETATVLTIHNLAHQGWADIGWLHALPTHRDHFVRGAALNMLAGGITAADAVVAVSPSYAREIVTIDGGFGLDDLLAARGDRLVGIRNGIDTDVWNPATDPYLPSSYGADDLEGKAKVRAALQAHVGWDGDDIPTIAMVTRLVEQKGVDVGFAAARFLDGMNARMMILGSGERALADWGRDLADRYPDRVWFHDAYDVPLSHLLFAGADLLLMPSRFEPCGLAQMQAMAYGTIPVVTDVGGLRDTVIDADRHTDGNGFVAGEVGIAGVVDALHRALAAWRQPSRRRQIVDRGMRTDWSWSAPAMAFASLYEQVLDR